MFQKSGRTASWRGIVCRHLIGDGVHADRRGMGEGYMEA